MIEIIHKFHSIFQRLIVVESQVENVYELTKQCQRIYKKDIQVDKSERIVNRIDMQKQRRTRTFDVVAFSAPAPTIFASSDMTFVNVVVYNLISKQKNVKLFVIFLRNIDD